MGGGGEGHFTRWVEVEKVTLLDGVGWRRSLY